MSGPDGWLGKPEPRFVYDHLKFAFDGSRGMLWLVLAASGLSALLFYKRPNKFQLLTLELWILPLLIGYIYSRVINPLLQDSVLLFSFPFLLMFLFSRFPDFDSRKVTLVFPVVLSIAFVAYIVSYKPFHLTDHFGRTKDLVENAVKWQSRFGVKKVDIAYNVDGPFMIEYNYERLEATPVSVLSTINNGGKELLEFRNMVQNSDAEFFVYGWSTKFSPPEIIAIIQESFPYLVEKKCWFNSAVYCFTKLREMGRNYEKEERIFFSKDTFLLPGALMSILRPRPVAGWSEPHKLILQELSENDASIFRQSDTKKDNTWQKGYAILDSTCIYSPILKIKVGDILKNPDNEILFTANMKMLDTASAAILVIEFQRDGKQLYWNGMESTHQIEKDETQFQNVYFGQRLPKDIRSTDTVTFYCYSKNGKPLLIDHLEVRTLKGHPGIYGSRPDLE